MQLSGLLVRSGCEQLPCTQSGMLCPQVSTATTHQQTHEVLCASQVHVNSSKVSHLELNPCGLT